VRGIPSPDHWAVSPAQGYLSTLYVNEGKPAGTTVARALGQLRVTKSLGTPRPSGELLWSELECLQRPMC
jgi:hypothetical protein